MSSTGSPIVDGMIQPFRRGAKRISEFLDHPVDSIKEMLGSAPTQAPPAAPPPDTSWHDQKTREATDSFKPKMLPRAK